jgi:hypothetical protein
MVVTVKWLTSGDNLSKGDYVTPRFQPASDPKRIDWPNSTH